MMLCRLFALGCASALFAVSLCTVPASAGTAALSREAIDARIEAAAERFAARAYTDALALLEALDADLGDARRSEPNVRLMIGRCLQLLGRPEEALRAYQQALPWTDGDSDAARQSRARAEQFIAEVRAKALGDVTLTCAEGVAQVNHPARGLRGCPARVRDLAAGVQRFEPIDAEGMRGEPVEVTIVAGQVVTARLSAPRSTVDPQASPVADAQAAPTTTPDPPSRWRFGARLGLGMATLLGDTVYTPEVFPGLEARIAGTIETPRLGDWLSGQLEVGVGRSVVGYHDAAVVDAQGRRSDTLTPGDVERIVYRVDAAFLGRACVPDQRWTPCVVGGLTASWPLSSTEEFGSSSIPVTTGTDEMHLAARGGVDVRPPASGWRPVFGVHAAFDAWPGGLQFEDTSLAQLHLWVDLGLTF